MKDHVDEKIKKQYDEAMEEMEKMKKKVASHSTEEIEKNRKSAEATMQDHYKDAVSHINQKVANKVELGQDIQIVLLDGQGVKEKSCLFGHQDHGGIIRYGKDHNMECGPHTKFQIVRYGS